jgi:anaerobic ribonucleoside-triphosphate reductase activating protein
VPNKIAVAIYFAGCTLRCKGCQNRELWDPASGELTSAQEILEKISRHPLAEYVVFLGGEPTDQMDFLVHLCQQIKQNTQLGVAIYSGREFEVLPESLLGNADLVVCGPFRQDLLVNKWPASSNQRVFVKEHGQWKC